MNRFKILLKILVVAAIAMVITGCENANKPVITTPTISKSKITIYELASKLGMKVSDKNSTYVTLKDSSNTVLVFTYSDGSYYVNGKESGNVGPVTKENGVIRVREALVSQIKPKLKKSSYKPSIKPTPTLPRTYAKVMLDPGHGGKDPGAIAQTGLYEKTVNIQIAHKVAYLLRKWGITVQMTRTNDVFVELDGRVAMTNRFNPDLFVSIHADACDDRSTTGYSVYVARIASPESKSAAGKIVTAMKNIGFNNRGMKQANYRVLVKTKCPAVLIEMGYLSNRYQATLLGQKETQQKIAYSIARGIYNSVR